MAKQTNAIFVAFPKVFVLVKYTGCFIFIRTQIGGHLEVKSVFYKKNYELPNFDFVYISINIE